MSAIEDTLQPVAAILCTGGADVIRKEAWSFCRTIPGVRLCRELEEPKGPKGQDTAEAGLTSPRILAGPRQLISIYKTGLSVSAHTVPNILEYAILLDVQGAVLALVVWLCLTLRWTQVAGAGTDEWGGGEGKQLEGSGALGAVREMFISPLTTPAKDQAARC